MSKPCPSARAAAKNVAAAAFCAPGEPLQTMWWQRHLPAQSPHGAMQRMWHGQRPFARPERTSANAKDVAPAAEFSRTGRTSSRAFSVQARSAARSTSPVWSARTRCASHASRMYPSSNGCILSSPRVVVMNAVPGQPMVEDLVEEEAIEERICENWEAMGRRKYSS